MHALSLSSNKIIVFSQTVVYSKKAEAVEKQHAMLTMNTQSSSWQDLSPVALQRKDWSLVETTIATISLLDIQVTFGMGLDIWCVAILDFFIFLNMCFSYN